MPFGLLSVPAGTSLILLACGLIPVFATAAKAPEANQDYWSVAGAFLGCFCCYAYHRSRMAFGGRLVAKIAFASFCGAIVPGFLIEVFEPQWLLLTKLTWRGWSTLGVVGAVFGWSAMFWVFEGVRVVSESIARRGVKLAGGDPDKLPSRETPAEPISGKTLLVARLRDTLGCSDEEAEVGAEAIWEVAQAERRRRRAARQLALSEAVVPGAEEEPRKQL